MFHKVHFVERWGKGIPLIFSKEPNTEFEEIGRQFIVRFKRKNLEKVAEKISENQKKILKIIKENKYITILELAKVIGISRKNLQENLIKLKQKGFLKRIGPDKGGWWKVVG